VIEIDVASMNPTEILQVSLLVANVDKTTASPEIEVRGKGLVGETKPNTSTHNGGDLFIGIIVMIIGTLVVIEFLFNRIRELNRMKEKVFFDLYSPMRTSIELIDRKLAKTDRDVKEKLEFLRSQLVSKPPDPPRTRPNSRKKNPEFPSDRALPAPPIEPKAAESDEGSQAPVPEKSDKTTNL
jgi:hypothetical protein